MIKHIVFFKLKEPTAENIERTVQVLKNMDGQIPQLRSLEAGADVVRSERSYDLALIVEVDSLEELQAYQVHPAHQEVIQYINEVKDHTLAVDFEV
ncbi:Dabb family protein [Paenibacillus sp. F411]|uniref:Stress responsive alpha-beta barrel domain-containing protein n=1 Tax=Paenibacillus algicola TaxID=2565926 RepID=A0A4P8XPE4_9BACL|nr:MULTISPECIES: Dabb family protein [Paenibacillus]MBO2942541.1 Dabb family protein [Paenibacillus sp. F411]QCT03521.1 Stress responsive alpha-beta barrel domain-containing protein [Paenibacillus algicola]